MQAWSSRPVPSLPQSATAPPLQAFDTARRQLVDRSARTPEQQASMSAASRPTTRRTSATRTPTSPSTCSTASGATAGSRSITSRTSPTLTTRCWSGPPRPASTGRHSQSSRRGSIGEDMAALNVLPPRHYVGAVESMPLIVDLIEQLQRRPGRLSGRRQRVRGPVLRTGE